MQRMTDDEVRELCKLEIEASLQMPRKSAQNPRLIELRRKFAADPTRFSLDDYWHWARYHQGWSKSRTNRMIARLTNGECNE